MTSHVYLDFLFDSSCKKISYQIQTILTNFDRDTDGIPHNIDLVVSVLCGEEGEGEF